jgi:hypothetical protein
MRTTASLGLVVLAFQKMANILLVYTLNFIGRKAGFIQVKWTPESEALP